MSTSKPKKKPPPPSTDNDSNLQSEIANFASSLGLTSSTPSSGFNDSDFRKRGPKFDVNKNNANTQSKFNKNNNNTIKPKETPPVQPKPNPKPQPTPRVQPHLTVDNSKLFDKYKHLPKLSLMKANALGVWYADAAELEQKVIGSGANRKKAEFKNVEEWKTVVEKKKEVAERLLAQYVNDYETSRGQSGDIKMVLATQRSGTVTDKVSAHSVLVGDNPIANVKSIDSLLGMVTSKVGKRYAFTGFEALKEMFISRLEHSY